MPMMTSNEIKAKIADGTIFGVSVDTAVFYKYDCRLECAILNRLNQFKTGPIRVLFSEIVVNEIKRHIARDAQEVQHQLNKAIKRYFKRWKTVVGIPAFPNTLTLPCDPEKLAETQFNGYLTAVGGEVIQVNGTVDLSGKVLHRYFTTQPPFESGGQKKHEFPDGFALLSLESVAKSTKKLLLCVSPDNGWIKFAAQSLHVVCISDLDLALSYFNGSGRNIADQIMAMWKRGVARELEAEVERAFESRLYDADFEVNGWSPFEYRVELIRAALQFVMPETASNPIVIAADEKTVTFTTSIKALVGFYYITDSNNIGPGCPYVEDELQFQLVITVLRNIDPDLQVIDVEVTKTRIEVDLGCLNPFPHEDPTHEKY